jgi:hypothetical protein
MSRLVLLGSSIAAIAVCAGLSQGCAAQQTPSSPFNRGYIASLRTMQPALVSPPLEPIREGGRASDYLALGLTFYNGNQKLEAVEAFNKALSTGDLNNQGRALAYWHLFLSYRDEGVSSHGADALASFVTVASLLMQQSAEGVDGEDLLEHVRVFIDRFDLRDRLLLAEVTLEAIWAHKDAAYGRTKERPVLLVGARAQRLFLHVFKPCEQKGSDTASVRFSRSAYTVHDKSIDEATVECPDDASTKSFYFSAK